MEKIMKIILFIVIIINVLIMMCVSITKPDKHTVNIIDTSYNKVIIDSIIYNINIKDSIITELKKKVKYEVEQAINDNDSIAIEQFKKLTSAN